MKFLIQLAASDFYLSQGFLFSNSDSNPGFRQSSLRSNEEIDFLEVVSEKSKPDEQSAPLISMITGLVPDRVAHACDEDPSSEETNAHNESKKSPPQESEVERKTVAGLETSEADTNATGNTAADPREKTAPTQDVTETGSEEKAKFDEGKQAGVPGHSTQEPEEENTGVAEDLATRSLRTQEDEVKPGVVNQAKTQLEQTGQEASPAPTESQNSLENNESTPAKQDVQPGPSKVATTFTSEVHGSDDAAKASLGQDAARKVGSQENDKLDKALNEPPLHTENIVAGASLANSAGAATPAGGNLNEVSEDQPKATTKN